MKRKYLNILLSISVASVFIACGSGGGGGGTSTGSTCNNIAGSYLITQTIDLSQCSSLGLSGTNTNTGRETFTQTGCTAYDEDNDAWTVSGSTMSISGIDNTGNVSESYNISYTISGSNLTGTGSSVLTDKTTKNTCTAPRTFSGVKL